MPKKDSRREELEREAERELQEMTRRAGPGGGFGGPGGAGMGGPPGFGGLGPGGTGSPLEMMAEKVRRREVGQEVRGKRSPGRASAQPPPVEMFTGPVGSGLTPGFGPGMASRMGGAFREVPPAFTDEVDPDATYAAGAGEYDYDPGEYDEDEEMSITEIAVMDHAARHGGRPEDSVISSDPDTAEEMRDRAMQQFMNRRGQRVEGGVVDDPFAPAGLRGRSPGQAAGPHGSDATVSRLNTRRGARGGGAIARLQERRRREEEERRRREEEDEEHAGLGVQQDEAFDEDEGHGDEFADEAGESEATPEPEGDEAGQPFAGGALARLLAQRAKQSEEVERQQTAPAVGGGGGAGAPGRLHLRERLQARRMITEDEEPAVVTEAFAGASASGVRGKSRAKAAVTTKGARNVATKKAGSGTSEKQAAKKTPAAKRSQGIKATAGKAATKAAPAQKAATKKAAAKKAPAKKAPAKKAPAKKAPAAKSSSAKKAVKSAAKKSIAEKGTGDIAKASEAREAAKTPAATRSRAIKATAKKQGRGR